MNKLRIAVRKHFKCSQKEANETIWLMTRNPIFRKRAFDIMFKNKKK